MIAGPEKLLTDAVKSLRRRVDEFDARAGRMSGPGPSGEGKPDDRDKVSLGSERTESATYVNLAASLRDSRFLMLRELVSVMFRQQGISVSLDAGRGRTEDLRRLSPEKAMGLVADDGYWGVDQTSGRIVDFALSAAGNDPAKLDQAREGVAKGFLQAKKAFPGSLPDISQRTYDAVMRKLDAWAAGHAVQAVAPA